MMSNPWSSSLHPERVQAAEKGVHSCRVDQSYRVIWKHIKPNDVVLCLVDKHDEAYRRATRKAFTLEQGVVRVADIVQVGAKTAVDGGGLFGWLRGRDSKPGMLFIGYTDQELLGFGVPEPVLPHVRALDNLNEIELVERLLPEEVYDKLLAVALGLVERPVVPDGELKRSLEAYQGGDDLYRFLDSEEFQRALEGDMEEWMLFLAPIRSRS
jgi:hypothetical protein